MHLCLIKTYLELSSAAVCQGSHMIELIDNDRAQFVFVQWFPSLAEPQNFLEELLKIIVVFSPPKLVP